MPLEENFLNATNEEKGSILYHFAPEIWVCPLNILALNETLSDMTCSDVLWVFNIVFIDFYTLPLTLWLTFRRVYHLRVERTFSPNLISWYWWCEKRTYSHKLQLSRHYSWTEHIGGGNWGAVLTAGQGFIFQFGIKSNSSKLFEWFHWNLDILTRTKRESCQVVSRLKKKICKYF